MTKRGDIVIANGRPMLVVQSQVFDATSTVTVIPLTSQMLDLPLLRINVMPDERNGVSVPSQIAISRITSLPRAHIAATAGRLDAATLRMVDQYIAMFLGLAD